jgi:hypothetical protein
VATAAVISFRFPYVKEITMLAPILGMIVGGLGITGLMIVWVRWLEQ